MGEVQDGGGHVGLIALTPTFSHDRREGYFRDFQSRQTTKARAAVGSGRLIWFFIAFNFNMLWCCLQPLRLFLVLLCSKKIARYLNSRLVGRDEISKRILL